MAFGEQLPAVNAVLNGASAVLLVSGYAAIKSGRVSLHKICMLAALADSTLFLSSYLFYHFAVRGGQPTTFGGSGTERAIYYAILLTHTLLAMVVAPLALITAYLGVRDRLAKHVRLARWTFPIWLYVSVTGVIIYLMLRPYYHVSTGE